jgi:hypothetical protein
MKTRFGYVSNSSSSSFIVATTPERDGKITIRKEIDLSDYGTKVSTEEELKKFFKSRYSFDDEFFIDLYTKCLKIIESGKVIFFGDFSDEDGFEEAFLCNNGLRDITEETPEIEIIESEAGY